MIMLNIIIEDGHGIWCCEISKQRRCGSCSTNMGNDKGKGNSVYVATVYVLVACSASNFSKTSSSSRLAGISGGSPTEMWLVHACALSFGVRTLQIIISATTSIR